MTELEFLSRAAGYYRERCGGLYAKLFDSNRAEEAVQDVIDHMTEDEKDEWGVALNPELTANPFEWSDLAVAEMGEKLEAYIDSLYLPDPDDIYNERMESRI